MTGACHYQDLRRWIDGTPAFRWLDPLLDESDHLLASDRHGDLPAWREALSGLPQPAPRFEGHHPAPRLGDPVKSPKALAARLQALHPWRKGPLRIGGVEIDTEWRSDWKWARISDRLDLGGHRVLDVGCGNGYYGWRMLAEGAECVVGFDPTVLFVMQWLAARHFGGALHNYVLPLGMERLPRSAPCFDSVFSMGVLYHRKDPVAHLRHLASMVRPGGRIVVETLVLDSAEAAELNPPGRYARMPNVHAIPSLPRLRQWLLRAGLPEGELVDLTPTTTREQRSTDWMRFESLPQCLHETASSLTIEGHPAPLRAMVLVRP